MYKEFDPDLKDALIACGFDSEIISNNERMVKRVNGKTFSAVPWALISYIPERPTIWLAELSTRKDVYANSEFEINEFVCIHARSL